MNGLQRLVWVLGVLASLMLVVGIVFMQAGPAWYLPIFVIAAIYCSLAACISSYLRRKKPEDERVRIWIRALVPGSFGSLAVVATALFIMSRIAHALARHLAR
jgi:hypothetical protein